MRSVLLKKPGYARFFFACWFVNLKKCEAPRRLHISSLRYIFTLMKIEIFNLLKI